MAMSDEALKAMLQLAGFANGRGVNTAEGTLNNFRRLLAEAAPGWQPIETAPKDGSVIVIKHNRGTWIHSKDPLRIACRVVFWNGRRWDEFGPDSFDEETVTHWMPLPEPQK